MPGILSYVLLLLKEKDYMISQFIHIYLIKFCLHLLLKNLVANLKGCFLNVG